MNKSNDVIAKVTNIFKKYPEAYTEKEKEFIMRNIGWINNNNFYGYMLREIYDELGMIENKDNLYLGFIELLKQEFGIDKDILEIGGGILPRLASIISLKQNSGSITVYDPRLAYIHTNQDNLILCKEKFSQNKLSKNCKLIIGIQPYGGTETIVKTACENNIDFMIALGDLPEYENDFTNEYEYGSVQRQFINKARKLVKESDLGELEETELDKYGSMYPVIYNKRKEK